MRLSQQNIVEKLIAITQQFLNESGYENRRANLDVSLQNHLGLGSFARAELFHRVEKQFDIQLDNKSMAEIDTLSELVMAIEELNPDQKVTPPLIRQHKNEKSSINLKKVETLIEALVLYATNEPNRVHIYFQEDNDKETVITYGNLLENSLKIAQSLLECGFQPYERVAIIFTQHPHFLYSYFGILFANCIPVPLYPPFRLYESYAMQQSKILQNSNIHCMITNYDSIELTRLFSPYLPNLKRIYTATALLKNENKAKIVRLNPDDLAVIQYLASGSIMPKGVLLTHKNLLANIRNSSKAIALSQKEVIVSWSPLYQVMGLVGMWLNSLYHGIPLVLMSPLTFLNRPAHWLWAIHYHNGTISGGPNVAYELCVRHIEPAQIEGLDLSSWRLAINGAETIQPATMERFYKKFAPYGFKRENFLSVYGLAESSACVTATFPNQAPRIDRIERATFEEEGRAVKAENFIKQDCLEFVSCGKAIPEHQIRVVDDSGRKLPDREVGNVQFKGPSSFQGYDNNFDATKAIYQEEGWWKTGDLGYVDNEELFMTGQRKNIIIKGGRKLSPEEIEELVHQILGMRKESVVAFGVRDTTLGTEQLIIVAETSEKNPTEPEKIIQAITEKIGTTLNMIPDRVILVSAHTLLKTFRGKLQREACKSAFLAGKLTKQSFWQLIKAKFGWFFTKLYFDLGALFKFIYSLYAVVIVILTAFPTYLMLWVSSSRISAICCHYWAKILFALALCPIKVINKNNLYKNKRIIYVANHESYLDALVFMSIMPFNAKIVAKKELAKAPVVGKALRKLNYILLDRKHFPYGVEEANKKIKQTLEEQNPVLIFPEGTFSYAPGLRPFKFDAFEIAAETNTPILPIAAQGTRKIFRDGDYLAKPGRIKISVGEPIFPLGKDWQELIRLRKAAREQIAKYCGEPSLYEIPAGKPSTDLEQPRD